MSYFTLALGITLAAWSIVNIINYHRSSKIGFAITYATMLGINICTIINSLMNLGVFA